MIYLNNIERLHEIQETMLIFVLKEMEHQTTGLPLNEEVISGLLWVIHYEDF